MKNLLILCPLPLELDAFVAQMRKRGHEPEESQMGPLAVLEYTALSWRLSLAGHGKTQFGIQTQFLLHRCPDTELVVCAGCAGGLAEQIRIFDVAVAEITVEHDYKLRFVKRPDPEFPGSEAAIEKLRGASQKAFQVHFGVIASGDEDIIDSTRANELKEQTSAIAVAWEGAGGARASKFSKVPFVEVRGITDTANNAAPIDFSANLKKSMANVCDLLLAGFVP